MLTKNPRKVFLFLILSFQIIISLIVKYFYTYNPSVYIKKELLIKYQFNSLFWISLMFIIISMFLTYRENVLKKSYFNGIYAAGISILPFIVLVLVLNIFNEIKYIKYINIFLSYTFFHLGGFQIFLVNIFGLQSMSNLFYALNLTIGIHILGFIIGDIFYLVKVKYKRKTGIMCEGY